MASASMDVVIRAAHLSPTNPRSPGPKPFAPGAGAPTVREESRFWCRRIPIWMWEHRPRCEKGVQPEHLRTRGGCSYGSRRIPVLMQENLGLRSEEHTSELQSREKLVCRLLLVKK